MNLVILDAVGRVEGEDGDKTECKRMHALILVGVISRSEDGSAKEVHERPKFQNTFPLYLSLGNLDEMLPLNSNGTPKIRSLLRSSRQIEGFITSTVSSVFVVRKNTS